MIISHRLLCWPIHSNAEQHENTTRQVTGAKRLFIFKCFPQNLYSSKQGLRDWLRQSLGLECGVTNQPGTAALQLYAVCSFGKLFWKLISLYPWLLTTGIMVFKMSKYRFINRHICTFNINHAYNRKIDKKINIRYGLSLLWCVVKMAIGIMSFLKVQTRDVFFGLLINAFVFDEF